MIPDEPTSFLAISDFTWDSIAGNVFLVKKAKVVTHFDNVERELYAASALRASQYRNRD